MTIERFEDALEAFSQVASVFPERRKDGHEAQLERGVELP